MISFGLVNEQGDLTNAGALLADESPIRCSRLFCTRWNGLNKSGGAVDALDDAEYSGSVILVSEQTKLQETLIPNVDIFKEIMIELIKSKEIDLVALRKEKSEYIADETLDFQLNDMILSIVDQDDRKRTISRIYIYRTKENHVVEFTNVCDERGIYRTIRCSNVELRIER